MLSTESLSDLITLANTFPTRGISTGERVGTHFSFSNSVMAVRFRAMSGGGITECSSTTYSGTAVATMSKRKSMLNSTSSLLLREVPW